MKAKPAMNAGRGSQMPKLSNVRLNKRTVEAAHPGQCISDCDLRGFRLVVSPKGTRRFVASYRVGPKGPPSMYAVGSYPAFTVEEARERARAVLQLAKDGIDPQASRRAVIDAPTFGSLCDVYLNDYAKSQALAASTVRNARAFLTRAQASLGKRKVAEITVTDIRKLHGDMRSEGISAGNAGVYTANRLLATLSKCFSLAIERGWRTDNPCKGVGKFPEKQRWDHLDEDRVGRLLDACQAYPAHMANLREKGRGKEQGKPRTDAQQAREEAHVTRDFEAADAIRLLLFTGARLNEVLRAEWKQFDLKLGLWVKPSSHTKQKREHRLELDGPALVLLRELKERSSHPVYLFPGNPELRRKDAALDIRTGQPQGITPRADLKRPWQTMCEIASLDGFRLHDLRRTTASFMISGGASLPTVGKTLGHTQASTTQRYAHISQSVQRKELTAAQERMAALQGQHGGGATVYALPAASEGKPLRASKAIVQGQAR